MAKKQIFIALAEPVVEIDITSLEDVAGNTAKITTIWKRPVSQEEANTDSGKLQTVLGESFFIPDEELAKMSEAELTEQYEAFSKKQIVVVNELIQKYLIGFKQVSLSFYDDAGDLQRLKIADSRKETAREGFWETAEECRTSLLENFLSQLPWHSQFVATLSGLLLNKNISKEAKLKN